MRTFRVIIVSTPIHFLLRSISQWRSFRYTTPWGLNYSHSTLTLSEDASPVRPCGIKGFSKKYTSTWDLCVQWTAHYYVVTFHPNLTDTFPYFLLIIGIINFHKFCVVDCESSGPPTKPTHLLNESILNYSLKCPHFHIFRLLRNKSFGKDSLRFITAPPVHKHTFRF